MIFAKVLRQVSPKAMKQTTGTMLRLCGGSNNCVCSVSPKSNDQSTRSKKKRKKKKVESKMSSVHGKLGNAPDPGRLRRRRRFQTSKPWLLFLAFSAYLTRISSPGLVLAIIQIVNLRASSTPVKKKNKRGT